VAEREDAGTDRVKLRKLMARAAELSFQLETAVLHKPSSVGKASFSRISHSQPPWNAAAASVIMQLSQLARSTEAQFRVEASQPVRRRGGSDKNTLLALESIASCTEAVDDHAIIKALHDFTSWSSQARRVLGELELPQRLPRLPGQSEPVCPFCKRKSLRAFPLYGYIACILPLSLCHDSEGRKPRAQLEYSSFTKQLELVWQDNGVGLPVPEEKVLM
jgi:hypothetical protein